MTVVKSSKTDFSALTNFKVAYLWTQYDPTNSDFLLLRAGQIESLGNEPLLETIRALGGWPVLGESSGWTKERQRSFDWLDLLIKFRQFGFSNDVLIDLSVTPDFRNNTRHIIDVSTPPS